MIIIMFMLKNIYMFNDFMLAFSTFLRLISSLIYFYVVLFSLISHLQHYLQTIYHNFHFFHHFLNLNLSNTLILSTDIM